jgi:hypothetical protein
MPGNQSKNSRLFLDLTLNVFPEIPEFSLTFNYTISLKTLQKFT